MSEYMVDVNLPANFNEEFIALIPDQRSHISELLEDGILSSYTLSMDRSKLWAIIPAKSEEEVMDLLSNMPLAKYMRINIYEVAFRELTGQHILQVSLN